MSATGSTQFLCCGAHSWCQVIAWLEMVSGVIGGLVCGMMIHLGSNNQGSSAVAQGFIIGLWVLLASCALTFFFGLMLMLGTTQRNLCFLWTWIVLTSVGILFSFVSLFTGIPAVLLPIVMLEILLNTLFVSAAIARAKEISEQQA